MYLATLDREPDTLGHADWTSRLQDRIIAPFYLAEGFLGSREFQTTYGALDDTAFVTLLYRNVLDRAPDAEELAYWLGRMAGGTRLAAVQPQT